MVDKFHHTSRFCQLSRPNIGSYEGGEGWSGTRTPFPVGIEPTPPVGDGASQPSAFNLQRTHPEVERHHNAEAQKEAEGEALHNTPCRTLARLTASA